MFKALTLSLTLVFSVVPSLQAQEVQENDVIIPAQSCHLDYFDRRKQLARKALLTPVVGAVALPIAVYAGAGYGATVHNDGWAALGFAILGGYGAILGTATIETITLVKLVKIHSLVKLIEEAHAGEGKRLKRYTKSVSNDLNRQIPISEVAEALVKADMSGILCDGSMRGKSPNAKLRKRLARKSEIKSYLRRALR